MDTLVTQTPSHLVTIGQVQTRVTSITTGHSVEQGIGTCSMRIPAMFSWVVVGASVTVQMGYAETGTHPAFIGTVVKTRRVLTETGWELNVDCDGQLSRMVDGEETDLTIPHTYLGNIAVSLASLRGVTPVVVDRIKSPDNWNEDVNWIFFGGNPYVDDGKVVVKANQGLFGWISQKLNLFGYRIFDRPAWDVKIGRIWGTPGTVQHTATEGVDIFRADRDIDLADMVTYWRVEGSSYTDADGVPIKFISIPASVPPDNRLRPKNYRAGKVSDSSLSSQFLVDTVRKIHEINYSQPSDRTTWEMPGNPWIQPGDVISINSEVMGHTDKSLWVMSVRHQMSDQGYWTTIEAWSGSGAALPSGSDEVMIPVRTAPVHVGDEDVPWYAQPAPSGKEVTFDITVPDDYTAMMLEWYSHGCNSYFLDGASSESSVSKIIVEQGGEEVGSAELPMQPENYERRLPYGSSLTHWGFNRVPIPGRVKAGIATVKIVSGEDKRISEQFKYDDFEVRNLVLKLTGVGTPILPERGG